MRQERIIKTRGGGGGGGGGKSVELQYKPVETAGRKFTKASAVAKGMDRPGAHGGKRKRALVCLIGVTKFGSSSLGTRYGESRQRQSVVRPRQTGFEGRGDFCIKRLKIPRVTHTWGGFMQAFPRVIHGEDLCKTRHELLMGRFYAKPICIICRESACILDISWGGFMQKRAIRGKPCNQSRFA